MRPDWPLVDPHDDGIRPAARPDECFYCQQKVGQPHKAECVIVTRKVKVCFTVDLELDEPFSWDAIEFRYNDGSWCADSLIDMLAEATKVVRDDSGVGRGPCLCNVVPAEVLGIVDDTPSRKLNTGD